jgi:crossover junction endodeoxyribonuclease RuvC
MRILGVDPGLNITGYGVLEENDGTIVVIEAGVLRTKQDDAMEKRLLDIGHDIETVIDQLKPEVVAIEELYAHYSHPRTAIIMGHARGIILMRAAQAGLRVFPYAATKIKNALTGNGRASKEQVQRMICTALGLSSPPEPPDVADALAVALCHLRELQHDYPVKL